MELGESLSPEDINCLKNRLLLIPEFIDNEYLKLYYELIIKNQKKENTLNLKRNHIILFQERILEKTKYLLIILKQYCYFDIFRSYFSSLLYSNVY